MIKRAWRPLVFTVVSTISSKSVLKSASSQAGQLLRQCAVALTASPPGGDGPDWGKETLWGAGGVMWGREGWTGSRPWLPGSALELGGVVERNTLMPRVSVSSSTKGFSQLSWWLQKITLVLVVVVVLFVCFYHYILRFWPSNPYWMNRWTNEWMNEMICKVLCNSDRLGMCDLVIE